MRLYQFAAVLMAWSIPATAQAQDQGVLFTGGTVNDGFSAYAGAVTALPGARLGQGFAVRGTVNGGRYHYESGAGDIRATYVGAEAALVYQTGGSWGWANLSAGPRVTDTSFSPDDPGNEREGTQFDLGVGTDGALNSGAFRLAWFASAGVWDESYQVQLRPGFRIDEASQSFVGIEASVQGDPTYDSQGIGLFYGRNVGTGWNGQISGGVTDQEGRSPKAYVSLGVSRVF